MIYEFKCNKCSNIDEASFMVKARPGMIKCSKCGSTSDRLEVPTSLGGIHFKAPGFYSTDNDGKKGHKNNED